MFRSSSKNKNQLNLANLHYKKEMEQLSAEISYLKKEVKKLNNRSFFSPLIFFPFFNSKKVYNDKYSESQQIKNNQIYDRLLRKQRQLEELKNITPDTMAKNESVANFK